MAHPTPKLFDSLKLLAVWEIVGFLYGDWNLIRVYRLYGRLGWGEMEPTHSQAQGTGTRIPGPGHSETQGFLTLLGLKIQAGDSYQDGHPLHRGSD